MARLPEGALMQRAAAGLAYAVLDLPRPGGTARGCCCSSAPATTAATRCTPGRCWPGAASRCRRVLLSPEQVHAARAGGAAGRRRRGSSATVAAAPARPDVVVDGIVGIGGRGGLREDAAAAVAPRCADVPVVAVDVPSGVDVDTGRLDGPARRRRGHRHLRHPQGRPPRRPGRAGLLASSTSSTSASTCPTPAVTALQEADVRATAAACRRRTRTSTPAAWSACGPARSSTRAPGCSASPAPAPAWPGWSGTSAARPTWCARSTPRSSSARAACRPGWSGPGGAPTPSRRWPTAGRRRPGGGGRRRAHPRRRGPLGVPALLTPHAGELARMLGVERDEVEADQLRFAREAAERYDAVVLLKGRHTLVADARRRGAGHHGRARRGWRPPEPATCSPGCAGRCSPPGWTPSTPARSAPGCTAPPPPWPVTAARHRAGRRAGPCPWCAARCSATIAQDEAP